jgi:hypothetical protein
MLLCSVKGSAEPPETGSFGRSGAAPPGPEGFHVVNARLVESAGNAGHLEGPQVRAKDTVDGGVSVGFCVLALLQ